MLAFLVKMAVPVGKQEKVLSMTMSVLVPLSLLAPIVKVSFIKVNESRENR